MDIALGQKKNSAGNRFLPIHLGYGDVLIPLNATDKNIFRCGSTQHHKVKIKLILNEINIT